MSKNVQNDKKNSILLKFADNLQQQRTIICKSDISSIVDKLNNFANISFTEEIISQMESGISVSIEYWIFIWLYFQNSDKISNAYDIKEMIYLSKQEFVSNIEEEILKHHQDKK